MTNLQPINITDFRAEGAARAILLRGPDVALARPHARLIRLMLVEDDGNFREAATLELEDLGFEIESFAHGSSLLAAFDEGRTADVLVLDWNLPELSGTDLIPRIRSAGIDAPIVLLTGQSTLNLENLALDHGVLDFVDKSRGLQILAKRLRLIARASTSPSPFPANGSDEVVTIGSLALKPRYCRAFWKNTDVDLTLTEFKVVRLLATSQGRHVTYRSVYDTIHHVGFMAGCGDDGYRTNVRSFIKRVRNKFRALDPAFEGIVNEVGVGYSWNPEHGQRKSEKQ